MQLIYFGWKKHFVPDDLIQTQLPDLANSSSKQDFLTVRTPDAVSSAFCIGFSITLVNF